MLRSLLSALAFCLMLCTTARGQKEEELTFCGELLPDSVHTVKERWFRILDRQAAHPSHLTTLKRRASVVFPIIDPVIASYGIPSDFRFLPLLESAAVNRAVSRRGAAGFWQIMPETGRVLGLRVEKGLDERYDLLKATHAACRYLKELYTQLGSWMLVAAAYNAGPTYVQSLRRRHPGEHPISMPYRATETQHYVYQAMAIKELLTRPDDYREYFNDQIVAELSGQTVTLSDAERAYIMASYQRGTLEETDSPAGPPPTAPPHTEALEEVTLIPDAEVTQALPAEQPVVKSAPQPEAPAPVQILTRRVGDDPLTEGRLLVFEVIQPGEAGGQVVAVGDLLYAYIDLIEPTSGRVFLHTDHLVRVQTQATVPLRLSAVDKPKQPGVIPPPSYELASRGWRLAWEQQ